jgi:hypothetical protein
MPLGAIFDEQLDDAIYRHLVTDIGEGCRRDGCYYQRSLTDLGPQDRSGDSSIALAPFSNPLAPNLLGTKAHGNPHRQILARSFAVYRHTVHSHSSFRHATRLFMFANAGARCDQQKRENGNHTNGHNNPLLFLEVRTVCSEFSNASLVRFTPLHHRALGGSHAMS